MNKDIQTLIEPNSIERWLIEKGFNNEVISRGRLLPYIYTSDAIIMYIQKVAFSLFKWRKVSEELPKVDNNIICKRGSGNPFVLFIEDELNLDDTIGYFTEWMPIPQID
ncbi:hypothetical protein [Dysgonomonas capnocytophagoides]|uniref:hypothetical protein n=1 Tax=Dysgonomonas capnocytophagoides TaxID=45254 RepID=UPI000415F5F1|nr:hypothetical protein [Dysgonomonas capnocytophagoides]